MVDLRVAEPVRPRGPGVENLPPLEGLGHLDEHLKLVHSTLFELMRRIAAPKRLEQFAGVTGGQLDSSGNLTMEVMNARQGFSFHLLGVTIEVATFETTTPRTPAAPYTNAAFWLGLFVTENSRSPGQGELIDFLPNGANTGVPAAANYNAPGKLIRSGESLTLKVVTGPASQRLTVRYEGLYEAIEL